MKSFIPSGYKSVLSIYDTQKAIGILKRLFEDNLSGKLHLHRVSAPLFVDETTLAVENIYFGVENAEVVQAAEDGTELYSVEVEV